MRAVREIVGGVTLACLAAATVIGGLWLAVTEGSFGPPAATSVAIQAETTPTAGASPTALVASPTQPSTATLPPTATATHTQAASETPTPPPPTEPPTQPATPTLEPTLAATDTQVPTDTPLPPVSATPCAPPSAWVPYVVAPGDTLFQLGLRYGLSTAQLQAANCLAAPDIKYGQILYVPILPSATPAATATPAPTPSATPIPAPLQIDGISVYGIQVDPSRPNGAIVSLFVNFSGGAPPYTIYNDKALQLANPFPVLTDCGGTLLHTLRVLSADGQSAEKPFYYGPVTCP